MDTTTAQWFPIATHDTHSSKDQSRRHESYNARKPLRYFFSANTPLHIPLTPGWFKLLPVVIILLSLVSMIYSACIDPPKVFVSTLGGITVVSISGALAIQIWAPVWYCYYVRLVIDLVLFGLWIGGLVGGLVKARSTNTASYSSQKTIQSTTMSHSPFNTTLTIFVILEIVLFSCHSVLSAYYIHLHRALGRHSKVIRNRDGKVLTRDDLPLGIWQVTNLHQDAVETPPQSRLEVRVGPRPEDAHARVNPLALDPLRISPYEGTSAP